MKLTNQIRNPISLGRNVIRRWPMTFTIAGIMLALLLLFIAPLLRPSSASSRGVGSNEFGLFVSVPGNITIKSGNYIGTTTTETFHFDKQIFSGSTNCSSGGGSTVSVTGVDSITGHTFSLGSADSVLLTVPPSSGGSPYAFSSDQNGPFVSWQTLPGDFDAQAAITFPPGPGNQICVAGFDGSGTREYDAKFYAGIELLDSCGNPKTSFRPGETMQVRVTGGIDFEPEPLRFSVAGGSPNECTFEPLTTATFQHVTTDPQIFTFTFPSSDADIPAACLNAFGTQHITGTWRVVLTDSSCGCIRSEFFTQLANDAPLPCPISCPNDITVSNDPGQCGAIVTYPTPTGSSCDHISGSTFGVGDTLVTCTSSTSGSSCSFHVTVNDDQNPSITAPANVTVNADSSCSATGVSLGSPTVSDNCPGTTVGNNAPATFPLGTTTVKWTVTDASGHTASANQSVTVVDSTAPVISGASTDPSSLSPPNHKLVDVTVNYSVTDNCGPVTTTLTVTSSEPDNGLGDGDVANDVQVIDSHHVRLRAERSGNGPGRVYTITISSVDGAGNATSQTVTVTVAH